MKKLLSFSLYFITFFSTAQVSLLKDLNGTSKSSISHSRAVGVIGKRAIYLYKNYPRVKIISIQTTGVVEELDSMILDTEYSYELEAFPSVLNGKLVIYVGQNGHHLIATDGTKAGTSLIKTDGYIDGYSKVGNDLYTSYRGDLQKLNLTTMSVTNVEPSPSISIYSALGSINDSICLFVGKKDTDRQYGVYRHNLITKSVTLAKSLGTTVKSMRNGFIHSIGNKIAFFVNHDKYMALYTSDGTSSGTSMVGEFEQPFGNRVLTYVWNNKLFFEARKIGVTATNWITLWATDGIRASELQSANDQTYLINPRYFAPFNGKLYFKIDGGGLPKLCYTDGTTVGTKEVTLSQDGGNLYVHTDLVSDGEKIYFGGYVMNSGKQGVFSYSKTNQLQNYYWGSDIENFFRFSIVDGRLIFNASTDETGYEFYILGAKTPLSIVAEQNQRSTQASLYPNPARESLWVKNSHNGATYRIIDGLGRDVQSGILSDEEIFISNLPLGLYTLICNADNFTFMKE